MKIAIKLELEMPSDAPLSSEINKDFAMGVPSYPHPPSKQLSIRCANCAWFPHIISQ